MNKAELRSNVLLAKNKIEALRKADSLIFPIFTDLHTYDIQYAYAQRLLGVLRLIREEIEIDITVNLGDNLQMLGRERHILNDELKELMSELLDEIYSVAGSFVINVNGNHDAIGTDFFKPDFWNEIVKGKYGITNAHYDAFGSYFYVDFDEAKTRFVILSLPSDSDLDSENPKPIWAFGERQLNWLEKDALDTDKYVIILSHVPLYYGYSGDEDIMIEVWDGEKVASSHIADLCGEIADCDRAAKIINEFAERSARLVACFSGHTHYDLLLEPHEKNKSGDGADRVNPLSCCQVVTTTASRWAEDESELKLAVDIAVWTPSTQMLDIVRVGDGDDRHVPMQNR